MQPVPFATLLALAESGWRIDRVLECCVQRANDLSNAPIGDPRDADRIETAEFFEFTRLLARRPPAAHFEVDADGKTIYLVQTSHSADARPTWRLICELLNVGHDPSRVHVVENAATSDADILRIKTRSLLGIMQ